MRTLFFLVAFVGALGTAAAAQEPANLPEANAPVRAVRVSAGVIAGLKLHGSDPTYPPIAKSQHVSGVVIMHAIIGRDGNVQSLDVVSGNSLLNEAAVNAVKTWNYKPFLLNGEPTAVDTTITVNFNLPADAPGA